MATEVGGIQGEDRGVVSDVAGKVRCILRSSFVVDLGEMDDSHFLDKIARVDESMRDSVQSGLTQGIYNLQQILAESEKTSRADP